MARPHRTTQERRAAADARRAERASLEDAGVVMEAAAAFLSVRPRSIEETRRRLRHLGYPHGLVDEVVERLAELRYLDDEAFARWWVESRDRARPRGTVALRRELALKGVAREAIDRVLDERSAAGALGMPGRDAAGHVPLPDERADPEREAAERLLGRRAASLRREPDPRRRRQKAYALLARNGFTPDLCADVARSFADEAGAGVDDAVPPSEGV